jgi:hypothetical protein
MNRFLIKYLLLVLLFYQPKSAFSTHDSGEPAFEGIVENSFRTEIYSDSIDCHNPFTSVYEQRTAQYQFTQFDSEDDFEDDGGYIDSQNDYNDSIPTGDLRLPFCLYVTVYGLWKCRQQKTDKCKKAALKERG